METTKKVKVNFAVKMVGFLAHDNNFFDRTCSSCKGMYSSFETHTCPKCGAALTYLTTKNGHAMSISEGTIFPAIGDQEEKDKADIGKRKNGLLPRYRFKTFGFATDAGAPPLPENHQRMKKGALVEIVMIDHQFITSWFQSEKYGPMIEMMATVLGYKGDTITVLRDPKVVAEATVAQAVLPDGSLAPVDTTLKADESALAEKDAQIQMLKAQIAAMHGNAAQPTVTPPIAPTALPAEATVSTEEIDPFELV